MGLLTQGLFAILIFEIACFYKDGGFSSPLAKHLFLIFIILLALLYKNLWSQVNIMKKEIIFIRKKSLQSNQLYENENEIQRN